MLDIFVRRLHGTIRHPLSAFVRHPYIGNGRVADTVPSRSQAGQYSASKSARLSYYERLRETYSQSPVRANPLHWCQRAVSHPEALLQCASDNLQGQTTSQFAV